MVRRSAPDQSVNVTLYPEDRVESHVRILPARRAGHGSGMRDRCPGRVVDGRADSLRGSGQLFGDRRGGRAHVRDRGRHSSGSSPAPALTTCWYARRATATTSTNAGSGPRPRRPCCPDHPAARASAASWPDPREICAREPCSTSEIGAVLSSRRGRAPPSTPLAAAPPLAAKETGGIRPRPYFYGSNLYFDHRTVMTPNRGSRPKRGSARREGCQEFPDHGRRPETPHRRPGRPVLASST